MSGPVASADRTPAAVEFGDLLVLFDWNGTVVLDHDRARGALNSVLEPRGLGRLDPAAFGERFHLPFDDMFRALGVAPADLARAEAEWNEAMIGGSAAARPGARESLAALAAGGAHVGVVSAASHASVAADAARFGLRELLASVHTSTSDKLAILRAHRPLRRRAVYVGDTEYDMRCARQAGFQPVGVAGGYAGPERLRDAGAAWIVSDLRELLELSELGDPPG
ncbi:HAD family hydrolase [Microbacterium album]|uniref:HAD family hydrolase n=1 Tax=Microbacterium album TaxID=2053191 RepID=A0A917IER4_9MICO|nr:HAD hydrolase-like protein [Microbacterium album]GGH45623.1 hypothetical protein GCM10010921_21140 [Microbacterium album]